ncbi:glycosyltransferase family 2 protein [Sphingobacterium multivorum]|uniref:glycosyltransferase family 2 protein n=1 Tax=Sphingobacterium multivorum TaxID=28454 RepID=UPI00289D4D2E|nr:glycosyltransferase family 2 protein [Sphingobacterium multivorum]
MHTKPLISVAIPAYKERYLKDTIHSILCQTIQDFELIIVDDASPQQIKQQVELFDDARIQYFRNEKNLGKANLVENWNRCLSYARGKYFCLICDDDLYEPSFLEKMLALSEIHQECNVFRSRVKVIDSNSQVINLYPSSPNWESAEDYLWHSLRFYRVQSISEFFFRREKITLMGGYSYLPLAWGADYLSIYNFSLEGGIASVQDCSVSFRMSGENISSIHALDAQIKLDANRIMADKLYKFINENESIKNKDLLLPYVAFNKRIKDECILNQMTFSKLLRIVHQRRFYRIVPLSFIKAFIKIVFK